MPESTRLVDLVQSRIDGFLSEQSHGVLAIAPELAPFLEFSRDLLRGGKRFRSLFCYWGYQAVSVQHDGFDPVPEETDPAGLDAIVGVAAGLEFFHAAALVHDDVMDNSDTRRGLPSVHRRFEGLHRDGDWSGSGEDFGRSGALLAGDLLLGWSDELLDAGLGLLSDRAAALAARAEFNRMRTEVTLGQYLDILEERSWASSPDAEQLTRAHRVIVYKSAKYSIEAPLALGASMGGASLAQLTALREFGLPLGIAYQLRDDLLGVFGDPEVTGKPSGDDLREGKRTMLVGFARQSLPAGVLRVVDELLGDPELDGDQVRMLQSTIRDSGAVDKVERLIAHNVGLARDALIDAPLTRLAREQLLALVDTVTDRVA